jgi:spore photoproduct lyase family protein
MKLLDFRTIFLQEDAKNERSQQILKKYPNAKVVSVKSHWNIPQLQDKDLVKKWNLVKKHILVLGKIKSLKNVENGRSTDFIAPSHSNGCAMACTYCFVARRKGYANPITVFTNNQEIIASIDKHVDSLPPKKRNQCDPKHWIYDIGCNSDASVDALISNNVKDLVTYFSENKRAKGSFATKYVNRDLLNYNPKGKTRIRFSLMPESIRKLVDVRTSTTQEKLEAINDFVDAGYEVHLNFSPIIVYDGWLDDYEQLLLSIHDYVNPKAYLQLKYEVIFLTHNKDLHELNLQWHPKAEALLWTPEVQEDKISLNKSKNIRYKRNLKKGYTYLFKRLVQRVLPFTNVRYIF